MTWTGVISAIDPRKIATLFDHLVGAGEQRWRHRKAERLGGLEIDASSTFVA